MKKLVCFSAILFLISTTPASADIVIDFVEVGGNVQATLSGDMDLNSLGPQQGTSSGYNAILPSLGAVSFTNNNTEFYSLDVGSYVPFGGGGFQIWDTSSGSGFAMFTNPVLGLPNGYVSGDPLSGSGTMFGETFASLGLTPGTYVNTFTNSTSSTITINIGSPVPEPSTIGLLAFASLGGLVYWRRKKRANEE